MAKLFQKKKILRSVLDFVQSLVLQHFNINNNRFF